MQWRITYQDQLPYATYQEAIAHLQQLPNLEITSYRQQGQFDYLASPIAYLELVWQNPTELGLLHKILQNYGTYTTTDLEASPP